MDTPLLQVVGMEPCDFGVDLFLNCPVTPHSCNWSFGSFDATFVFWVNTVVVRL